MAHMPAIAKDDVLDAIGPTVKGMKFRLQVSPRNCVGCGLCMMQCPGKGGVKALEMVEAKSQFDQEEAATYLYKHVEYKADKFPVTSVKWVGYIEALK